MTITHDELVLRAARWLRNTKKCVLVVAEPAGQDLEEQPDAIGWQLHGRGSILVECKAKESDFRGDGQKSFRRHPLLGMGRLRYYLTPPGLTGNWGGHWLDGWGLLEVHGRTIVVVREATPFDRASSAFAEQRLLVALVRRREGIMPNAQVFAEPEVDHG